MDLHRVRIFLSSFSSDCHLLSRRVIRIESSSRVSRRSDRNAPILRSTGLGFRPASRREERRGENGGAISGKSRTKLLSPGKKVNRTTDRKRRRWSNVFPPSLSEERSSLRAPVHSFSSSLPLAGKKKKGLDRIEIEEREREDEGETKISLLVTRTERVGQLGK